MPPEETLDENVDRGDDFVPTEPAAAAPQVEDDTSGEDIDTEIEETEDDTETEDETLGASEQNDRDEKGRFIPKDRFDEAVKRERDEKERLASRLAEIEKREADRAISADMQQASAKIKEMIKEHTQLLSDGELDKASELMGNILELQSDMADRRSQAYADRGRSQAKSEIQYDSVVARLELEYPEINPENVEMFDREAVRKVQAYMTGLMQMDNMTPSKALQESVSTILGAKRAAEDRSADSKAKEAEDLGMRRKEAAVTKAMKAKNQQPADIKEVGKDHDREGGALDASAVMKMSWEEFVKLPESELSKMRGDHVG